MQVLNRFGIGGSEAAGALGIHPYLTPIALWQRKRAELAGEADPFPVYDNEAMRWGRLLEDPIRLSYAERFGVRVQVPPASIFHPEHAWRRATPDGLVFAPHGQTYGLEVKTANARLEHQWGADGTDEVPEHYAIQCLWYAHCLDVDRWDLAALIGGSDFRCYTLRRDRELEEAMVATVTSFWEDNVLGGKEPALDSSEDFKAYLVQKWPGAGGTIKADAHLERVVDAALTLRAELETVEQALRMAENELRAALGDATVLETSKGRVLCRPRQGRVLTNWERIARDIAGESPLFDEMVDAHTTRAKSSRPLLLPKVTP